MNKLALCIGINNYPGTSNDLGGCVNDARAWKSYLESMGFSVTLLLDSQATRANILSELAKMLKAEPDFAIGTYSGHGTQNIDTSGDEIDGYDEAIYVYDGMLIDDKLRAVIDENWTYLTSMVFVIDSCFSGSVTRLAPSELVKKRPRFMPNPNIPRGLPKARGMFEDTMPEILLTGCNDSEYSYDALIDGNWHGAFSYYALNVLKSAAITDTWRQVYNKIGLYLPSKNYPQHPQLEGMDSHKDAAIFTLFDTAGDEEPPAPDPEPEPDPEPPAQIPWYKQFWNALFGWLYYWKGMNR